ncbi:erythromycin esterase-like protein [Methylobacterium sp. R2-1]|nr:erythromycin esterase-like protein [Methylobacterium sp. R2-1]
MALTQPRLERAIGVVYRSGSEFPSHYFKAVLPQQFDAFVWFEQTAAVTGLPVTDPCQGESETFPTGL